MIFLVPDDVFLELMHKWLTIHDLVAFDSSACCRKERGRYLQTIRLSRRDLNISGAANISIDDYLRWLCANDIHISTIRIEGGYVRGGLVMSNVQAALQVVQKLNLTCKYVSDDWFANIIQYCGSLKAIHLDESVLATSIVLKERSFVNIGMHCPNIKELSLKNQRGITSVAWKKIAEGCVNIEILSVEYSTFTTEDALDIAQHCTKLRKFHFSEVTRDHNQLDTVGIILNINNCVMLNSIQVLVGLSGTPVWSANRAIFPQIRDKHPNLKCFIVTGSSSSSQGISRMISECRMLRRLHFDECEELSERDFVNLLNNMPHLRSLNLTNNHQIRTFSQYCGNTRTIHPSSQLDISLSKFTGLGNAGVEYIVRCASNLHSLFIVTSPDITSDVMASFIVCSEALHFVNFMFCASLDKELALAKHKASGLPFMLDIY